MTPDSRLLFAWTRDLAVAYVAGLVLGAPLAVAAVWVTGIERLASASLLLAMGMALVTLRRRDRTVASSRGVSLHVERHATAATAGRRRVA